MKKVQKEKRVQKNKKIRDYILLGILTLLIIFLVILFNEITYGTPTTGEAGLPSLGLWKPFENAAKIVNLSENETLIEKNRQIENPSAFESFKATFKQYWVSYVILFLIVFLLIAWVLIVFRVYNG